VTDERAIVAMLAAMASLYPHVKLDPENYKAYARMLRDIPLDELQPAMRQVAAECEFFPTVAKIRGKVLELRRLADDSPSAFEAWQEVAEHARGSYAQFSHERIGDAVCQLMGARTPGQAMRILGQTRESEVVSHRARFIELYDRMEGKSRTEQAMLPEVREAARRILSGQAVALEDNRG